MAAPLALPLVLARALGGAVSSTARSVGSMAGGLASGSSGGKVTVELEGFKELEQMLKQIAPNRAKSLAAQSVNATAAQVRNEMRKKAPKDEGTLRKAIHSKRRRGTPTEAVAEVRISHGSGARHNAWYWHFKEFGTTKQPAAPFIVPTVEQMGPQVQAIFREEFGKRLERELVKAHDAQRRKR